MRQASYLMEQASRFRTFPNGRIETKEMEIAKVVMLCSGEHDLENHSSCSDYICQVHRAKTKYE